jgi:serine/threonine protein kinase/Flp pilus assembly protein TadD
VKLSPPEILTCADCGAPLEETSNDDLGCMVCLLRLGLSDARDQVSEDWFVPDQFGPYVIERHEDGSAYELGRGAMGVTYRATDTSLQRAVALKIIKTDLAGRSAEASARFTREARAAAALRHPNVATVYHFGIREETGQCFYAMELVEGETLDARVRRTGPIDVHTTVKIAQQITAALGAAEKRRLVHRDLKPANVMIAIAEGADGVEGSSDIHIKVIDFGVAKALAEKTDPRVLTHGGLVGTPAFASPEQFTDTPVDVRSDIYSLGATLWYLLTGKTPFADRLLDQVWQGPNSVAPPVEQLKAAHVSSRLISLLVSMLAIEPAARPSVRDLATRLENIRAQLDDRRKTIRRLAVAAGLIALTTGAVFLLFRPFDARTSNYTANLPEKSIAVLPFDNRSDEKENAFFADGIQDDVLTSLVKVKELKVIGRSSVMSYREAGKRDLHKIGQQLGVTHVLEGSVRRVANRVLIHANLTDTRDGHQLWAERYDRTLADSIGLQSEIAEAIAVQLQAKLSPNEKVATKPTQNPEAYLLYLRARERETGYAKGDVDIIAAEQLYAQAIALDPKFALAHARRSILNSKNGGKPDAAHDPERKLKARAEADEALRASPALGEAHLALAYYFYLEEEDPASALKELAVAETTSPNNGEIFLIRAASYRQQGRWRESIASYQRAQDLDPRNSEIAVLNGRNYRLVRDWRNAEKAFTRALEIEPNSGQILLFLTFVEWQSGNANAFHAAFPRFPAGFDQLPNLIRYQAMIDRDFATAEKALEEFKEGEEKTYLQGYAALARGDVTAARRLFETLRPSFEARVRDHPEDAEQRSELGMLYAYLGRKEDAIRECRRAVDLVPVSKDPLGADLEVPLLASKLALVYARTGETDQAITLIEHLLTTPGAVLTRRSCSEYSITLMDLRLRWEWDPLRSNPRFQKILAGPEPKTVY